MTTATEQNSTMQERWENQPQQHEAPISLSSLLNSKHTDKTHGYRQQEYLPTPVTPASSFPASSTATSTTAMLPTPANDLGPAHHPRRNENNTQAESINGSGYGSFALQTPTITATAAAAKRPSTPGSGKPYVCHECNQTFSRPHNLKSHLTTHSSERPFQASVSKELNLVFSTSALILLRAVQCDVCKHHFRRHHDLKRHQKLHTGERPYVCKICHRSFARLDALNRHRRAEGGTACSAGHQNQRSPNNATPASRGAAPSPIPRPVIPQLHIPHPASQPFPNETYPHPTTQKLTSTTTDTTTNLASMNNKPNVLPSPSALSCLPVSDSADLMPIYKLQLSPPKSPADRLRSTPYRTWSYPPPSQDRSIHSSATTSSPKDHASWQLLEKENEDLRQEIAKLRAEHTSSEINALKSRLHDLEVENNVLRSLIMDSKQYKGATNSLETVKSEPSSPKKRRMDTD
ncbi:hypothetical protein EC973_007299 [Apophysomyces ossiformis]|uniref:C2H2-type domain-containing protein n=1 Tax=Apophysomyces ossiformis TaxID=679940 RepID=A0A8H7BXZ2_9FUNG|nr:hypothetical protein EC973_007299 [Apophysomyces ossiformis]